MCDCCMEPDPQVIDKLVQRIVEAVHPLRIILFGSAVRGQMDANSDLDVLVVVPNETHRQSTARRIYRYLIGFGFPVDIVVATEDDLRQYGDNYSLVYYPALQKGKEIYAP